MPAHRAFIITSLGLAAVTGSSLGLYILLGWLGWVPLLEFAVMLSAHAQLQVFGFVTLFTMGVAMMVLPSFLRTRLQPAWLAYLCLLGNLAGIGANLKGASPAGAALLCGSTLAFLVVLRRTRKSAPEGKRESSPLTRGHAVFLATGSLWLLAAPLLALVDSTAALETVLWGFAGLYIAGIGLRVHPGILGIKGLHGQLLMPSALVWNLALLLRWSGQLNGPAFLWPWLLALGTGLFLVALRPFRKAFIPPAGGAWLRYFVRTSYLWLLVVVALTMMVENGHAEWAGAARHMLATGFILTMMMGMGLRMIPAFETRRLVWKQGPWLVYGLITIGTAVRVPAQALAALPWMALGGALQFLAILAFTTLILGTYAFGKTVQCQNGQADSEPTAIFAERVPA